MQKNEVRTCAILDAIQQLYLYSDTVADVLDPEDVGDVPDPPVADDAAIPGHDWDKVGHLMLCQICKLNSIATGEAGLYKRI